MLLISLDCSTLPLIRTLKSWVLSKKVSNIIFWVFGMIWLYPGLLGHWRTLYPLSQWLQDNINKTVNKKVALKSHPLYQQKILEAKCFDSPPRDNFCPHWNSFLTEHNTTEQYTAYNVLNLLARLYTSIFNFTQTKLRNTSQICKPLTNFHISLGLHV